MNEFGTSQRITQTCKQAFPSLLGKIPRPRKWLPSGIWHFRKDATFPKSFAAFFFQDKNLCGEEAEISTKMLIRRCMCLHGSNRKIH